MNKKYYTTSFAVLVSLGMSFFVSIALTLINVGFVPDFWRIWLVALAVSFLVSLPISLIIIPVIEKMLDRLTGD